MVSGNICGFIQTVMWLNKDFVYVMWLNKDFVYTVMNLFYNE